MSAPDTCSQCAAATGGVLLMLGACFVLVSSIAMVEVILQLSADATVQASLVNTGMKAVVVWSGACVALVLALFLFGISSMERPK